MSDSGQRWRQIEELYEAALAHDSGLRAAFLQEVCADEALRREVESLLGARSAGDQLLEQPALRYAAKPLAAGAVVGQYCIEERIGAGGMGVVYRALDTRLNRPVAVKFLSDDLADSAARRRFQREAQLASSLNHPHIVTVYDVGEFEGSQYLVTEYLDGGTLREWAKNPRPWRQTVELLTGVADGLATAHAAGILHRDIKPENILLSKSGYAKLGDFGLAKLAETSRKPSDSTLTERTRPGSVLGTPAYMSPEQASGMALDVRSDIFSFGIVLYEILSGVRPFNGKTDVDLLHAIVHTIPPPLKPDASPALQFLVGKALEKDPADRYQTMRDLVVDLRRMVRQSSSAASMGLGVAPQSKPSRRGVMVLAGGGLLTAGVGAGFWLRSRTAPPPARNFTYAVGPIPLPELSPDGSALVSMATSGIVLRRLDALNETQIPSPTRVSDYPTWSPDGSEVLVAAAGLIRLRPGGAAIKICPATGPTRGASWSRNGVILFASRNNTPAHGLFMVPAAGGSPVRLQIPGLAEDGGFFEPEFLPDGDNFLFLHMLPGEADGAVYLATLKNGRRARGPLLLRRNQTGARFSPAGGGRLLFVQDDNLYAQPLDVRNGKLKGDPQRIVQKVYSRPNLHKAFFSVSRTGVLAWREGKAALAQLTWFDRRGQVLGTAGPPLVVNQVRLSPDGKYILVDETDSARQAIIESHESGLLSLPAGVSPSWLPGSRILYWSPTKPNRLLRRDAAGGTPTEIAIPDDPLSKLMDVSPDGKTVLYRSSDFKVYSFRLGESPDERSQLMFDGRGAASTRFSPDGRWIVYPWSAGDEIEVYVQPFAFRGLRKQISSKGGIEPVWRGDGKEIVYRNGATIYSVPVEMKGDELLAGTPVGLFHVRVPNTLNGSSEPLAITADGSAILFAQAVQQPDPPVSYVMTAWDTLLKP